MRAWRRRKDIFTNHQLVNIIYIYIYISEKIGQSGGASRWRVCYQRGLPRLVKRPLLSRHAIMVEDSAFSHKIDYVKFF